MNPNNITYFAETDARNRRVKFDIKDEDRLRHIYSIGKTGMGKSTMLENMAIQDIQNGNGMAFLDPHGKTADLLLDYIPEHRIQDVIYFAPFDTEYPISFNVMEDVGPERRHLVVAGLMSAFEKIWVDAWSARMAYILQNTLAALLEYPGATMLGINRVLTDKAYRNEVVNNVKDPTTKSFWTEEFAKYTDRFAAEATPAIQNKVGQFTSNPLIRNIIGQPKSSFDIRKIMDEKKILIVNLSKGLVGENNANLLGSMLVTKIYLAAMSRADASPQDLKKLPNFYLYVDEFQSFANKSFADILSESRKYKLSLNITHQYIEQMAEEVRAAVFGNVGTMISFRVGSFDAEILEKEFAPVFTAEDMVNLGFVQIYLKLMIDGVASQPFSATTLPPIEKPARSFKEEVMEFSRKHFASPKKEVEERIMEWHKPVINVSEHKTPKKDYELKEKNITLGEKKVFETKSENRDFSPPKSNFVKMGGVEQKKIDLPETKVPFEKIEKNFKYEADKPKNNNLASAIAGALKEKESKTVAENVILENPKEIKTEIPKAVSLSVLEENKNRKNKEATPEKRNALKEALQKAMTEIPKNQNKEEQVLKKQEEPKSGKETVFEDKDIVSDKKETEYKKEKKSNLKNNTKENQNPNEIPEEVLRKILKGN